MKGSGPPLPDELKRGIAGPMRWRLLLALIIISGVALLHRVDALLQREYAREASTQAVQADALIEGSVSQRVQLLTTLSALMANASSPREATQRFDVLAGEIRREMPDIATVYLLDERGRVKDSQGELVLSDRGAAHQAFPLRAPAMRQAAQEHTIASTEPLKLADGRRGTLLYLPIIQQGRVTGYVAAAFAYERLFSEALAGQLRGRYPYRVTDEHGEVIAVSAEYPLRISRKLTRTITIPGGHDWTLEVPIASMQPFTPRLVNWVTGVIVLVLVSFLAVREELRSRRFAAYSHDLELLSRDLLDANMRLEEHAQQIAEANRAKSRFLANVSHELRTPLNAIVGYNALALDGMYGDVPQPLRGSHERIRAAADHLLGLVNDVLDLSKIEVGRMEIDVQQVQLDTVLDGVATVVEPAAEAKNLRVDVVIARDLPTVYTDARHLRQILLNLVANAIKFTERGAVTLVARRADTGDTIEIAVEDTGIGISESDLARIFDEFEQVRPSGRGDSMQRGTGLGLAIARKLARLLGGDVTVVSHVGFGSRFTVVLPFHTPAPPPRHTPVSTPVVDEISAEVTPISVDTASEPQRDDRDSGEHSALSVSPARGVDSPRMPD
jgi:signal transduction histidine kinase